MTSAISGSENYADSTVNVVITLSAKADAVVSISNVPTSKTVGDADFTLTGSVTNAGTGTGVWTWTTSDPTVFKITTPTDTAAASATVKILKAGSATITAKYESDTTIGRVTTAIITVDNKADPSEPPSEDIWGSDIIGSQAEQLPKNTPELAQLPAGAGTLVGAWDITINGTTNLKFTYPAMPTGATLHVWHYEGGAWHEEQGNQTGNSITVTVNTGSPFTLNYTIEADTAAQMALLAKKLGVSNDTMKLNKAAILALGNDDDPKGSDFAKLQARATSRTKNAITLKWKKQKNADGYMIFGNLCGKPYKLLKTIKKNGTVKWTQKSLKKGKNYKYLMVAYKNVNGEKMTIAAAVVIHTNTRGGKVTVAKSLKVTRGKKAVSKLTVKKGKSVTIKATQVKEDKKLKIKSHRAIKFESSNKAVAKVSKKGKITGVKKGTTTIYVYAQNGIYKTVKVTVK